MKQAIQNFFKAEAFAVIGVSANRNKFGNRVFCCLNMHYHPVYPIHPLNPQIENIPCYATIDQLPENVTSLSVITPPSISEMIIDQAYNKGIKNIWFQPGAESLLALQKCQQYGINTIAGGPCILVELNCFSKNSSSI